MYQNNIYRSFFTILFYTFLIFLNRYNIGECSASDNVLLSQLRLSIQDLITQDFMKEDGYLERWLNLYDNDLELTIEKFKESLDWRLQNNIDNILFENVTKLDELFSYGIEGIDKDGRLVTWAPPGKFNLRQVILNRQDETLLRTLYRAMELTEHILYQLGVESGAHNISRAIAIFDTNGVNFKLSGSISCIQFIVKLASILEANYPLLFYKIYFINSPNLYWNFIKGFLAEPTKETILYFSHDKTKWSQILREQIPLAELSEELGGTKPKLVINGKTLPHAKGRKLVADEWLEKIQKILLKDKQN